MREPFFDPDNPHEQKLTFVYLKDAHRVQAHANTLARRTTLTTAPRFASYKLIIARKVAQ